MTRPVYNKRNVIKKYLTFEVGTISRSLGAGGEMCRNKYAGHKFNSYSVPR